MNTRSKLCGLLSAAAVLTASTAHADVTVYRAGRAPVTIQEDMQFSKNFMGEKKLNLGEATMGVMGLIQNHAELFRMTKVNGETLALRKSHRNEHGASLRFVQRYNRVPVEGAELVAIFGADGALESLNTSLMPTPTISVQPSISREKALEKAIRALDYRVAEEGRGHNDGLVIVSYKKIQPLLVWQFSLREKSNGSKPLQVQVLANGPNAGSVHRTLDLGHNFAGADINIYDATITLIVPNPYYKGVHVLENGKPVAGAEDMVSPDATGANDSFDKTLTFYSKFFKRKSFDNEGGMIEAAVNTQAIDLFDPLGQKQNAAWLGPWKIFTFGAGGDILAGFAQAIDVVGHEFTHAVVGSTSNLTYAKESGALNESMADVFGSMIQSHYEPQSDPFLLGETVLRGELAQKAKALRDMLHPHLGVRAQPETVSEIDPKYGASCEPAPENDNCGVHILSGIPNRAAALIVQSMGWEKTRKVFYRVMTERLRAESTFVDYRDQVLAECKAQKLSATNCAVMKRSFEAVGL